jgi:hypothetical protein
MASGRYEHLRSNLGLLGRYRTAWRSHLRAVLRTDGILRIEGAFEHRVTGEPSDAANHCGRTVAADGKRVVTESVAVRKQPAGGPSLRRFEVADGVAMIGRHVFASGEGNF